MINPQTKALELVQLLMQDPVEVQEYQALEGKTTHYYFELESSVDGNGAGRGLDHYHYARLLPDDRRLSVNFVKYRGGRGNGRLDISVLTSEQCPIGFSTRNWILNKEVPSGFVNTFFAVIAPGVISPSVLSQYNYNWLEQLLQGQQQERGKISLLSLPDANSIYDKLVSSIIGVVTGEKEDLVFPKSG